MPSKPPPREKSVRIQALKINKNHKNTEHKLLASILATLKRNTDNERKAERNVANTLVSPRWRAETAAKMRHQQLLRSQAKVRIEARKLAMRLRSEAAAISRKKLANQTYAQSLVNARNPVLKKYAENAARRLVTLRPKMSGGMGYMGPGGPMKRR